MVFLQVVYFERMGPKLQVTKIYDLFEYHEINRDIHIDKVLEASMKKYGFMPSSPIQCIKNGDGKQFSQSYLYYQLDAAKVERNISTIVEKKAPIPESHLRPLTSLEPEEQREVWEEVVETAPEGKVTAKHVARVIQEKNLREIKERSYPRKSSVRF